MPSPRAVLARINGPGLATIVLCLAIWELLVRGGAAQYAYLPAPSAIVGGLVELMSSGQLWADTAHTLQAVILGWAIAGVVGIVLGVLMGISPTVRRYSLATVEVLRPMPGIAFVPVALLLFGFSLQTELVVIVLPALWPVLVNTMGGVASVHPRLLEVGATFRLARAAVVTRILIPAAFPSILVGLRLSLTLALVLAIVAEMVGNPTGLGYAVVRDQQALRPELMFADVFVVGVLGIVLNQALVRIAALRFPAASGRMRLVD
jgi:ABC-type nitrate/sulfonate/bicarbonate transport system permease component